MRVVHADAIELADANILKKIEKCGRICYKSEDKITDTSCFAFVEGLVKRQHLAMLEHANICLSVTEDIARCVKSLGHGTYMNVTLNEEENRYLVSGNIRAWILLFNPQFMSKLGDDTRQGLNALQKYLYLSLGEQTYDILFTKPPAVRLVPEKRYYAMLTQEQIIDLPNLTEEEAYAHLYLTGLFTCDRGVTHELVRHRPASFAQESTRYCNYANGKFSHEITCVKPVGLTIVQEVIWVQAMENAERFYLALIDAGCSAQQARGALPTDVKANLVITANLAEWQHIFNLRYHGTTGTPHPKCKEVMSIWYNYVSNKEGYGEWIQ